MVQATSSPDNSPNGQLGAVPKPRGWRWAKAKMYRELRADGKASEARKIFRESEHWRRHFDTVVTDSSGNVFADLGLSEPALRLENARLRARVIELEELTTQNERRLLILIAKRVSELLKEAAHNAAEISYGWPGTDATEEIDALVRKLEAPVVLDGEATQRCIREAFKDG